MNRRTAPVHRLLVATLAVLAVGALAAGCSSDDKDDAADKKSTTTVAADQQTTTTVTDEEFAKSVSDVEAQVEAAGTDACKLVEIASSGVPQPSNPTQVEQAVDASVALLNAFAASSASDPAAADALRKAATDLKQEAEDGKYSIDVLKNSKILQSPDLQKSMSSFQTAVSQQCAPATTAPAG